MKWFNYIILFCIPYFSCEAKDWLLEGTQKEKKLVIDISKDKLTIGKEYTIPPGAMLHIKGEGKIFASITDREEGVCQLNIKGMLFIGDLKFKSKDLDKISKIVHPLHQSGYLKITMDHPKAILQSKGVSFYNFGLHMKQGNAKFEYSEFTGVHSKPIFYHTFKGKAMFNYCHFNHGEMVILLEPSIARKHIQFNKCITSKVSQLPLTALFCMNQCDILNRPFPMGKPDFKKITKLPKKIYIKDKDFLDMLNDTHGSNFKGFKIKPSKKAFNQKLGFAMK